MLHTLDRLLTPALMARLTLWLNHVLGSESVATDRLRRHAGRTVQVALHNWPTLLPPPPVLAFGVTPAGLLEWIGATAPARADLNLGIDAANPALLMARLAAGERPNVTIDGDAALATDVDWLVQNLRWDVAADLDAVVGPVAAQQLSVAGAALARGLRAALQKFDSLRPRT